MTLEPLLSLHCSTSGRCLLEYIIGTQWFQRFLVSGFHRVRLGFAGFARGAGSSNERAYAQHGWYRSVHFSILEQVLRRNVKRFRGVLVRKAHRLLYHSTLGSEVIQKKKKGQAPDAPATEMRGSHIF